MFVPLYLSYSSAFPIELWTCISLCYVWHLLSTKLIRCNILRYTDAINWTSLRISGLPEGNNEDVCAKVLDLCNKKLRIPVEPNEIERVNRLGRPGGNPRQILVKFATYGTRASVFKAKAVLRPGGRHPHAPWTPTTCMFLSIWP